MSCLVALTGTLASGKSTVASVFEELGAKVLDADKIVEDLYRPGGGAVVPLVKLFGPSILDASGGIDKSILRELMVGNPSARKAVEEIVHPLVRQAVLGEAKRTEGVLVVEAALVVETGSWRWYDVVVVVTAPKEVRIQRATARGMSEAVAVKLDSAQLTDEEKASVADIVIANDGDIKDLKTKAKRAWQQILNLCAERQSNPPNTKALDG